MKNFSFAAIKPILVSLCFLVIATIVPAQEEYTHLEDEIDFSTVSPPLSRLDRVKGWALQDNGAWMSEINRIPLSFENKTKPRTPKEKLGQSNIIELQLRRVMVGKDQYIAFIHFYKDGRYEFPILQEDWTGFKSFDFYIFKGEKLAEILPDDFEYNTQWGVNLDAFARGTIRNYVEDDGIVEDEIKKAVIAVEKGEIVNNWNLVWGIHAIKNGEDEVFRFNIVKTFRKEYLVDYYTNNETWELNISRSFWELRANTFKSFIRDAQEYLVDIDEGLVPISRDSSYQNYYNWGVVRYQMGDYTNAIRYFKKAVDQNPETDDFMIYSFRGNAFSKKEMYNDAISDFDKALSLQPKDLMDYSNWVRNYFNRGVSKFYLDDLNGACKDWNKALELGFGQAHDYVMEYCE
ncbi:MAG: tetratricopeptide repeat protein [Chlorobi bacterium]|nr:tetratricopeptide repeat protein [Chlorobiota bacterium]